MALKHFAKATGAKALEATGAVTGFLLGKAVNGIEAVSAMECLADAKPESFMAKAVEAAKVTVQKLDAKLTMPFASPEADFNGSLTSAFSTGQKKGYTAARKPASAPKRAGPSTKLAPT